MKKLLSIMLACLMLVAFVACSKTPADDKMTATPGVSAPATGTPAETTTVPSQNPTEAPTQAPAGMPVPDLIEFVLNEDGTATNGVEGGPEITGYGAFRTVSVDEATGMNVVMLGGGQNTYDVWLTDLYGDMRDSFSLEVYFKADAIPTSGYVGVADNCENGGFGIYLYAGGRLTFEVYLDGRYQTVETPIKVDTWYHIVATWDSDILQLFVNGELVDELETDWAFLAFTSIESAQYLSIGGCATANGSGGMGVSGTFGKCNLYSFAVNEEQAVMLYQNIVNPVPAE